MTEMVRSFAVGDSVISTTPLIAPPVEPPGVRLEIPAACRGVVVDARPYSCNKPYAVAFDVADGVLVDVDVTEDQIVRVSPPGGLRVTVQDDLPPLEARMPKQRLSRKGRFVPSKQFPHYYCKLAHLINVALLSCVYVAILQLSPKWTLFWTAMLVLAMYGTHLRNTGRFSLVPEIIRHITPAENEELEVCHHCARRALAADFGFSGGLAAILIYHFGGWGNKAHLGAVPYVALGALAFVLWLFRTIQHELAARVVPKYDN